MIPPPPRPYFTTRSEGARARYVHAAVLAGNGWALAACGAEVGSGRWPVVWLETPTYPGRELCRGCRYVMEQHAP